MRRLLTLALVLASLSACMSGDPGSTQAETSGPPEIQFDVVRRHAEQFDVDVPDRPPGSQHELAAASYILGHLQLAGYAPYLDRVPVADTLNSTNVVALPPSGERPDILVTIPYDTGSDDDDPGRYIGLFLELARAVHVVSPDHRVAFVAVGAESADRRGTRRLAQYLLDEDLDPLVYTIGLATLEAEDAILAAGFDHRFIHGQVREVAEELMPFLTGAES